MVHAAGVFVISDDNSSGKPIENQSKGKFVNFQDFIPSKENIDFLLCLYFKVNDTVWKIAIKLISALPADCPMNVRDILVFSLAPERINLRFLESGFERLELGEKYKGPMEDIKNPSLAVKLYERFVSPNGSWTEAAMPKDWLYLPLIDAYSNVKNEKLWKASRTVEILNLLKLELVMPELTQNLSPNLRFSRMLLLYLCDTVFIHPPESELPQQIIAQLGTHSIL